MLELRSASAEDTRSIAAAVAGLARAGDLIVLAGQMGAGKTAFAQGFARALGVTEPVTSPTYTIVHSYPAVASGTRTALPSGRGTAEPGNHNDLTLHHADLYRLEHTAEVADLALGELLDDDAVVLVEWGDVVDLGQHLQIELRQVDEFDDPYETLDDVDAADVREITITSSDRRWDVRWDRLAEALQEWTS